MIFYFTDSNNIENRGKPGKPSTNKPKPPNNK